MLPLLPLPSSATPPKESYSDAYRTPLLPKSSVFVCPACVTPVRGPAAQQGNSPELPDLADICQRILVGRCSWQGDSPSKLSVHALLPRYRHRRAGRWIRGRRLADCHIILVVRTRRRLRCHFSLKLPRSSRCLEGLDRGKCQPPAISSRWSCKKSPTPPQRYVFSEQRRVRTAFAGGGGCGVSLLSLVLPCQWCRAFPGSPGPSRRREGRSQMLPMQHAEICPHACG